MTETNWRDKIYEAIKHGDEEHRRWLGEALDAVYSGQPVPPPKGTNAIIAAHNDAPALADARRALEDIAAIERTDLSWRQAAERAVLIARVALRPVPPAAGED